MPKKKVKNVNQVNWKAPPGLKSEINRISAKLGIPKNRMITYAMQGVIATIQKMEEAGKSIKDICKEVSRPRK